MSLLDAVMTASGDANFAYGRAGRHVCRLSRITLREPSQQMLKPGFSIDVELLHSDRLDFSQEVEGGNKRGSIVRFNDPFRYPESALARVRRTLRVAKASKTGSSIDEATLGVARAESDDDKAFAQKISAEVKRLLGSEQPLSGAVITVVATEGKNKQTGAPYTIFEPVFPTEDDLKHAGLI